MKLSTIFDLIALASFITLVIDIFKTLKWDTVKTAYWIFGAALIWNHCIWDLIFLALGILAYRQRRTSFLADK